jgi:hypothetical protein
MTVTKGRLFQKARFVSQMCVAHERDLWQERGEF